MFQPPLVGREELYTQMGFFVQTILADRYIRRRELWVLSLKSLYTLEYGIKMLFLNFIKKLVHPRMWNSKAFFLNFVFYKELSSFTVLWIYDSFYSHFQYFAKTWHNFGNIFSNTFKFLTVEFYWYCWRQRDVAELFDLSIFS